MKAILIVLLISLSSLTSCVSYYFETPQPASKTAVNEIPELFRGVYRKDGEDVLKIKARSIIVYANDLNKEDIVLPLSDSLVIKPFDDKLLVNMKEENEARREGLWSVVCLEISNNDLILSMLEPQDSLEIKKLEQIVGLKSVSDDSSDKILNPDYMQLRQLFEAGLFHKIDAFKAKSGD